MSLNKYIKVIRTSGDDARLIWKLRSSKLIVSAGMYRSGSTLLFNILREICLAKWGDEYNHCWVGDLATTDPKSVLLVKTHHLSWILRRRANFTFYTFRDMRVAAVSRLRAFDAQLTLAQFDTSIEEYRKAKAVATMVIRYEDFIGDISGYISRIVGCFEDYPGELSEHVEEIVKRVERLRVPASDKHDSETLLHANHITGTGQNDWREMMPQPLIDQVNDRYGWWFEECGYSLK